MTIEEINAKLAESMGTKADGHGNWLRADASIVLSHWSPATDANDLLRVLCFQRAEISISEFDLVVFPQTAGAEPEFAHDGTPESITLAAATALVRALEDTT